MILSETVFRAGRILFPFILEILISDTHLDVICLARKDEKRLVLCFPSETSHCSVVTVRVHMSRYAEEGLQYREGARSKIGPDGCVRDAFNQAGAKHGCWDAKDHIGRVGEIRLADGTARRVAPPSDCKYAV